MLSQCAMACEEVTAGVAKWKGEKRGGLVVSESANESLPQVAGVAAMIFNFTRESHALILLLPFAYSLSFATFPPAPHPSFPFPTSDSPHAMEPIDINDTTI